MSAERKFIGGVEATGGGLLLIDVLRTLVGGGISLSVVLEAIVGGTLLADGVNRFKRKD